MINTEENWNQIVKELRSTNREGVEPLIAWLGSTDFKTAPASTNFHLSIENGLAQHSLNVLRFARNTVKELEIEIADESIILSALLHDICKVDFYKIGEIWDKEIKEKFNRWEKKKCYIIEDQLPLGHGEGSLAKVLPYIKLNTDEMVAIRFHMLAWDISEAQKNTLRDAMNRFPILKVIAIADQMAELYETLPND